MVSAVVPLVERSRQSMSTAILDRRVSPAAGYPPPGNIVWNGTLAFHWQSSPHTHSTTIGYQHAYGIQVC